MGEGESSGGIEEGLAWLRDFFRREAAESRAKAGVTAGDAEREQEPLDQAQREIGVKRLHRYICACQSRHLLGDHTASTTISIDNGSSSGVDVAAAGPGDGDNGRGVAEARYRGVVRELTSQYRATLHLNLGSEGGQREVQHGDELVILAAQTLLRLCELYDDATGGAAQASGGDADGGRPGQAKSTSKGYLGRVEAVCLLEAAMSCSPYNHHLKVRSATV
ncbi:unnamed protein product, partial [Ectocarpus fasciculatus]